MENWSSSSICFILWSVRYRNCVINKSMTFSKMDKNRQEYNNAY